MATQALSPPVPDSGAAVGSAMQAFLLAHPIGLPLTGGARRGVGTDRGIEQLPREQTQDPKGEPAAT